MSAPASDSASTIEEGQITPVHRTQGITAVSSTDKAIISTEPADIPIQQTATVPEAPPSISTAIPNVVVFGCARGTSDNHVLFEFDVTSEQHALVSQWLQRYKTRDDVTLSRCLSFGCYSFDECVKRTEEPGMSLEALTIDVPTSWPRDGRLWAQLQNAAGEHNVMLSPPFMPKSQSFVDLSRSVAVGKNTLRVYQLRDHSDCVFAVRLHRPIDAQVAEVRERRDHEDNWNKFLKGLAVFNVPPLPTLDDIKAALS